MSNRPRALADRIMRAYLLAVGGVGLIVTGLVAFMTNWSVAAVAAVAWTAALMTAYTGYRLGWLEGSCQRRHVGQWMMYPVDADGVPTAPPVSGQLLLDDPRKD